MINKMSIEKLTNRLDELILRCIGSEEGISMIWFSGEKGKGYYFIVDQSDYENVAQYKWHLGTGNYVMGVIGIKKISLHQYLYGKAPKGMVIDHHDCNKLNNTMSNLRYITLPQNSQNNMKRENTSSRFIGVSKARSYWAARYSKNYLGAFITEEHAAQAYDKHVIKLFGEGARINNIIAVGDGKRIIEKSKYTNNVRLIGKKWYPRYTVNGKEVRLGNYNTEQEASNAIIKYKNEQAELAEQEFINTPITKNKDGIAVVLTNKNEEILVDENLWYVLMRNAPWQINDNGYAVTYAAKLLPNGTIPEKQIMLMHRLILNNNCDKKVDHDNHNRVDNRVENLRYVTDGENAHNCIKRSNTTSIYHGVYRRSENENKYRAKIRHNNKNYNIGTFNDEIDAAKAYNIKALELYGDKAQLNIIE